MSRLSVELEYSVIKIKRDRTEVRIAIYRDVRRAVEIFPCRRKIWQGRRNNTIVRVADICIRR